MTGAAGQPDLAALYLLHRDAMYRMAYSVLRGAGRASDAEDVVSDAVVSVMTSPPQKVRNWEAFLLTVVKRKALDRIKSAEVRHAGPALVEAVHDRADGTDLEEEALEAVEREEQAVLIGTYLGGLDVRHRKAVWDTVALERPRAEVAAELNVTPSRISQMTTRALAQLREDINNRREADHGRQRA
jgi:RNA polymerase sigma factor (sigma-70 family)